jgi:hypothetical protein
MKLINVAIDKLEVSSDLSRSGSARQFEERLKASIDEMGLAEPLKVASLSEGRYLVVDGTMRFRALTALRQNDPSRFRTVPAYVVDHKRRYELRYQTDIYQDLLPSQLAALVEHLHQAEHVAKVDIARYIGVSPPTLRNYTGLWRLIERGGLFAKIVELMDVDVLPSSNPYVWLRLNAQGLKFVIERSFSDGHNATAWADECVQAARRGAVMRFPTKFVEEATDNLHPQFYREGEEVRLFKRDLGLRRSSYKKIDATEALRNLSHVAKQSPDPVLRSAAESFQLYLS